MGARFRLASGDSLVVATHNQGKLREFRDLFDPLSIAVASAGELGVPEPEENGVTFEENARLKAVATAATTGQLALADVLRSCRRSACRRARHSFCALGRGAARLSSGNVRGREPPASRWRGDPIAAPREVRLHALPCESARRGPVLRRDSSGPTYLAAARDEGLRLRSHIRTRWV